MKKILQVFKSIFKRKKKEDVVYICDPEKASGCKKNGCWYLYHGPCKCTKKKAYAKVDKKGRRIIATDMDIWNDEFREYCLTNPDILLKE